MNVYAARFGAFEVATIVARSAKHARRLLLEALATSEVGQRRAAKAAICRLQRIDRVHSARPGCALVAC